MASDAAAHDVQMNVPADGLTRTSPRVARRQRLRLGLMVTLVVILGFLCVMTLFALMTPINRPTAEVPLRETSVRATDLTIFSRFDPFQGNAPAALVPVETAAETRLNLKLFGTFLGEPASATIQGEGGKQAVYFVNDEIAPGVTLQEVRVDQVLLNRRGVLETLTLENREGLMASVRQQNARAPDNLDAYMPDLSAASNYVRLQPDPNGAGIRLYAGAQPQFFTAAGLVEGDRLVSVDGMGIAGNPSILATLPARLQQGPLEIEVEREGERMDIIIDLTGLAP